MILSGGGVRGGGACVAGGHVAGGHVWSGGMHSQRVHGQGECVARGACVARGWPGGLAWWGVWWGACVAGGVWQRGKGGMCDMHAPLRADTMAMAYGQWAGGTHPTGMHSCFETVLVVTRVRASLHQASAYTLWQLWYCCHWKHWCHSRMGL